MVIEHTFVTTLDAPQAMEAAFRFLHERGFAQISRTNAPAMLPTAGLEVERGKKNENRAKNVAELPQAVRLDYDRGRVNVAISITPSAAWGGRSFTSTETETTAKEIQNPKRLKLHHDLVNAIALGLERVLVDHAPLDEAARDWVQVEERIAAAARQRKKQHTILAAVLLAFIGGIIALIVYSVRQ